MRGLALAAAASAVFVATGTAVLSTVAARAVVTPPDHRRDPVRIHAIDPEKGTITLARTDESAARGTYTLVWSEGAGSCRLGEILDRSERTVTRRYSDATGPSLDGVRFVRVASAPERSLDDVGVPWEEVRIETELGPAAAWSFAGGRPSDWVVHVHGRGAVLTEPLRSIRLLHDAGWNSLVISYRNDRDAPPSPDGRFGLGATEWRDVESAMAWAVARGARRLVLVGWSMGGATVMQALFEARHRDRVVGVVLESPVVSWRATLALQGRRAHLPPPVVAVSSWLLRSPLARPLLRLAAPIPLDRMELVERADDLRVPVLLFHSTADSVVPYRPSAELARRRPDLVTYEQFDGARHVRNWNVDAPRWERAFRQWMRGLGQDEARGSASSRE